MLIINFSIIRYLKTFEMRTSGPYDKHYIVWGSHFLYHGRDFLPKWRLCKYLHLPRPAVEVGTRWRGKAAKSKRRVNMNTMVNITIKTCIQKVIPILVYGPKKLCKAILANQYSECITYQIPNDPNFSDRLIEQTMLTQI